MLTQSQTFKLQQKLSPQQIQLMKLIQLSNTALEERIKEEIQINPALEEGKEADADADITASQEETTTDEQYEKDEIIENYLSDDDGPEYNRKANNYSSDDEEKQVPLAGGVSFVEHLNNQINLSSLNDHERDIAKFVIGSLEEDGYLKRDFQDIEDDLAFRLGVMTNHEELDKVLGVIQEFDPPGVGARDLQECLILQLERKTATPARSAALNILDFHFTEFQKKHFEKLENKLGLTPGELQAAVNEIKKLNPKPSNAAPDNSRPTEYVIPDFIVTVDNGEIELTINSKHAPDLFISNSFKETLQHYKSSQGKVNKRQKEEVTFIKHKIEAARWFIEAIKQRQHTLYITMTAIIERQRNYFLTGDEKELKPMILKDIADVIHMDISTVSRVANNKFVQTPYGTFLVKKLFSESMTNSDGEDISTKEIKKTLEEMIEEEDKRKPLTDEALSKALKEKGYPVARRTVAKYREQLNFPVARMRKQVS